MVQISSGPEASGRVGQGPGRGVEGPKRAVEEEAFCKDQIFFFFHFLQDCSFAVYGLQNACLKPLKSPSGGRSAHPVFLCKHGKHGQQLCGYLKSAPSYGDAEG